MHARGASALVLNRWSGSSQRHLSVQEVPEWTHWRVSVSSSMSLCGGILVISCVLCVSMPILSFLCSLWGMCLCIHVSLAALLSSQHELQSLAWYSCDIPLIVSLFPWGFVLSGTGLLGRYFLLHAAGCSCLDGNLRGHDHQLSSLSAAGNI